MALLNGEYFHSLHSLVFWIEASSEERRFTALRRAAIMPREIYRDVANVWNLVSKQGLATLCRAGGVVAVRGRSRRFERRSKESGTCHFAASDAGVRAARERHAESVKFCIGDARADVRSDETRQNACLDFA
ncbi:hypothetical protein [Caballeronia sp. Lep1P3]|uniref:hypothetical protein n=1 Tax=Caballeronia sp. Lep1P3 TaxID=2878150 RepID=UPI001FD3C1B4|nr:hypothetical protein [Caballeronia sp. Lep1P3]